MIVSGAVPIVRTEDLLDSRLTARLDRLDFRTRKLFAGKLQGERRSKKRGQSVEFDDYRDYVPGDDLRFVDWNIYARFDRLFIKLFLEEEDLAVHVALDASASMNAGAPSKLLFAGKLAAALAYIGLAGNNRVGLSIFGRGGGAGQNAAGNITRLPEVRGKHHLPRILAFLLENMQKPAGTVSVSAGQTLPGPAEEFSAGLAAIARARSGKGVLIIISDFLVGTDESGYESGLRAVAAASGFDATCLQVLAPGELEPEREFQDGLGSDVRLTDVETGRAAEVTVTAAMIKQYKLRLESYCARLHSFCLARRMNHMLVRSDAEIEPLIFEALRRRGIVG